MSPVEKAALINPGDYNIGFNEKFLLEKLSRIDQWKLFGGMASSFVFSCFVVFLFYKCITHIILPWMRLQRKKIAQREIDYIDLQVALCADRIKVEFVSMCRFIKDTEDVMGKRDDWFTGADLEKILEKMKSNPLLNRSLNDREVIYYIDWISKRIKELDGQKESRKECK